MLSAHQEKDGFSQTLRLGAWAKVVGSIEGLRHKLDALTIGNIDEAQEKLKTLSGRLSELQRTLQALSTIRNQWIKVEAAKPEIEANTLRITDFEKIQTPLQLHTIGQLRNLILLPRANRAVAALHGGLDKGSSEAANRTQPHKQRVESDHPNVSFAHDYIETDYIPSSQSMNPRTKHEPGDGSVHAKENYQSVDRSLPRAQYDAVTIDRNVDKVERPEKIDRPPLALAESQTASEFEFDQRLLNDLIKDYGEFVIPSSPAPAEEAARAPRPTQSSRPKTSAEFPLNENVTVQRTLPATRQEGDLDRKLKKLIKDYGEYDLYSGHTSKKYRTGVVAAFAILALALAGIYFFSPSRDELPMMPSPIIRSDTAKPTAQPNPDTIETGSNAVSPLQRDFPDPGDGSGPLGSRNRAPVTKNKNHEKVGR
jgi:hypothetical protein